MPTFLLSFWGISNIIVAMQMIQLLYPSALNEAIAPLEAGLSSKGYALIHNPIDYDENVLGIAFFVPEMDVDSYLKEVPLLKAQLDFSSIKYLRILPLLIYDSKQVDVEALFDGPTGKFAESIFSGEFKPYGWDLSNPDNLTELVEIIEENYAE